MSILSTPTARPDRVYSLVSLVRELGGRVAPADAARWLAPTVRTAAAEQSGVRQLERVREVFRVARDLELLRDEEESWVSAVTPPSSRREFARHVHARLCRMPGDDPDAVILRAYAWFVVRVEQAGTMAVTLMDAKEISAQIAQSLGRSAASGEGRSFNPTKLTAWKDWMMFLGLGWDDLPGAKGFQPDPSQRVAEDLPLIFGDATRLEAHAFTANIGRVLPYLDEGLLFSESCELQAAKKPNHISRVLSDALRTLHDDGELTLGIEGDARTGISLAPDAVHPQKAFTHVSMKGRA